MIVAGYSSGGNFAALIAIHAIKDGIPLAKQILISPIVDLSRVLPGFKNYEDRDTDISEEFVQWVISLYLPPDEDRRNPQVSPFWKSGKEIKTFLLQTLSWQNLIVVGAMQSIILIS